MIFEELKVVFSQKITLKLHKSNLYVPRKCLGGLYHHAEIGIFTVEALCISNSPTGVWPTLYLDSYCYHMLHDVVDIRKLGVKFNKIRCSCHWQPIDVGFNNLFNSHFFVLDMIGILNLGKKSSGS